MTGYEFGDVVLVPFPFTDLTSQKKRPAVVVSSADYHRKRPDLIVMAVTSQVKPAETFGETAILRWKEAGLLKPSVIKPILATLEDRLVLRKLGRLDEENQESLQKTLQTIIGPEKP